MLGFLTDELQAAEDAGDRGKPIPVLSEYGLLMTRI